MCSTIQHHQLSISRQLLHLYYPTALYHTIERHHRSSPGLHGLPTTTSNPPFHRLLTILIQPSTLDSLCQCVLYCCKCPHSASLCHVALAARSLNMNAGAKVLGKHLARGFHHNIPLQPFTTLTHHPYVKRQSQSSSLVSLGQQLSKHFSQPAERPSLLNLVNAAAATAILATGAVATASASALPADELPRVGRCGIGKPQGGGRWGASNPQPNAMTVQQREGGVVGQAGEDAFFLADNGRAWGVADGVGGWASVEGADSAAYSRTLMQYALEHANRITAAADTADTTPSKASSSLLQFLSSASSSTSSSSTATVPLRILDAAYTATAKHDIIGSTTACIVTYDPSHHKLHYANLGDSGFLLVHDNPQQAPIRSIEKQHSFNCPYQLGSQSGDRPSDAAVATHDVYDNDILVLATDGFFDNLHTHEIVNTCRQHTTTSKDATTTASVDANALAEQLCKEAYAAASDSKRDTPFSQYCRRYGKRHTGGKMDDISVVIVQFKVKPEESSQGKVDEKPTKSKL